MVDSHNTVIVIGGTQGIGAGAVNAFLKRGYNVVANSHQGFSQNVYGTHI